MISNDKLEFEKLVHHCLCVLTEVASGGAFKIIYFHSGVSGTKNGAHNLIKKMCNRMSDTMLEHLDGIFLVHPNFALKTALLFYRTPLFMKNYKFHTCSLLRDLSDMLTLQEENYIENTLPIDIKLFDENKREDKGFDRMSTYHVGEKKIIKHEYVHHEDEKYRDYDYDNAEQSL